MKKKDEVSSYLSELEKTKATLDDSVKAVKNQLSRLNDEWMLKILELEEEPGIQRHRGLLGNRKAEIIQALEELIEQVTYEKSGHISSIFVDIKLGGVNSVDQATAFYSRIEGLKNLILNRYTNELITWSYGEINLLKRLVEVDYRYNKLCFFTNES